jgi:hypothetical protein
MNAYRYRTSPLVANYGRSEVFANRTHSSASNKQRDRKTRLLWNPGRDERDSGMIPNGVTG